jgi:hypothetical protein
MTAHDIQFINDIAFTCDRNHSGYRIMYFDSVRGSMWKVMGLYRIDQYEKLISKERFGKLNKLCEWVEEETAWLIKLNETLASDYKRMLKKTGSL